MGADAFQGDHASDQRRSLFGGSQWVAFDIVSRLSQEFCHLPRVRGDHHPALLSFQCFQMRAETSERCRIQHEIRTNCPAQKGNGKFNYCLFIGHARPNQNRVAARGEFDNSRTRCRIYSATRGYGTPHDHRFGHCDSEVGRVCFTGCDLQYPGPSPQRTQGGEESSAGHLHTTRDDEDDGHGPACLHPRVLGADAQYRSARVISCKATSPQPSHQAPK